MKLFSTFLSLLLLGSSVLAQPKTTKIPSRDEVIESLLQEILDGLILKMNWAQRPQGQTHETYFEKKLGPDALALIRSQRRVWSDIARLDRDLNKLEGTQFKIAFLKHTWPNRASKKSLAFDELKQATAKSPNISQILGNAMDEVYREICDRSQLNSHAPQGTGPAEEETSKTPPAN